MRSNPRVNRRTSRWPVPHIVGLQRRLERERSRNPVSATSAAQAVQRPSTGAPAHVERQDSTHRHHRSRKPQLNNLFYGFPGAKTAKFGFDSTRKEDHAAAGRARNDLGYRSQLVVVLRGLQRHRQLSGHRLSDERLR